ncbi:MAG: hypothetical protein F4Z10_07515 [Synechococcus sp. SB0666_bin_14]|nr:hypothetical protein [Synechococcus sp. SB0666_bin_14]MYG47691.1 hypothetical protein [Synechococcus sp. SB0675_bin_6]MYJ59134.1 hypothetical protein [Synechococcus sp. SB0672_bin_6]
MAMVLQLTLATTVLHATQEGSQLLFEDRLNGDAHGGTRLRSDQGSQPSSRPFTCKREQPAHFCNL